MSAREREYQPTLDWFGNPYEPKSKAKADKEEKSFVPQWEPRIGGRVLIDRTLQKGEIVSVSGMVNRLPDWRGIRVRLDDDGGTWFYSRNEVEPV